MKEFLDKNTLHISKINHSLINKKVKLGGIILKTKKRIEYSFSGIGIRTKRVITELLISLLSGKRPLTITRNGVSRSRFLAIDVSKIFKTSLVIFCLVNAMIP
jgi:hypothetical protein